MNDRPELDPRQVYELVTAELRQVTKAAWIRWEDLPTEAQHIWRHRYRAVLEQRGTTSQHTQYTEPASRRVIHRCPRCLRATKARHWCERRLHEAEPETYAAVLCDCQGLHFR